MLLRHRFDMLARYGAGNGARTHIASLEGWNSTIELYPHNLRHNIYGGEGRIRTYVRIHEQIYSLPPLTTRPPLRPENNRGLNLYHLKMDMGFALFCQYLL